MGGDAVCIAQACLAIVPHRKYRRLCCAGEKGRKKSLFISPSISLTTCDYVFIYTILPIETPPTESNSNLVCCLGVCLLNKPPDNRYLTNNKRVDNGTIEQLPPNNKTIKQ